MSNKQKLFSRAIGGFKKSEVVDYIEELNRRAKVSKEQSEFELTRMEGELAALQEKNGTLENAAAELPSVRAALQEKEEELRLAYEDVSDQRRLIETLQSEKASLAAQNEKFSETIALLQEKAARYEDDCKNAGGILMRAKAEAESILAAAGEKAKAEEARIKAENEKQIEECINQLKYLHRRRDELLSAFRKVKEAAGGFYDNIANALAQKDDEA